MTLEPGMTRSTCYHFYQVGEGMHRSPLRMTITMWSYGNSTSLVIVLLSKRLPMLPQLNTPSLRSWHKRNKKAHRVSTPWWPRSDQNWISLCLEQVWKKKERKRIKVNEAFQWAVSFAYKWIWIRSTERLLPTSTPTHPSDIYIFRLECRHKK